MPWKTLEDISTNENKQDRKLNTTYSHLYVESKTVAVTEIENRMVATTNWEERRGSERFCSKGT